MPRLSGPQLAAKDTYAQLRLLHPDAHCELDHRSPFELLVATVLSAQTTDKLVNQITPGLFARFGDAAALAKAEVPEVEQLLSRMGMFRQKAKNIVGLAKLLVEKHGGEVPRGLDDLVALPGVGRKTANVVMGTVFDNAEGIVVDTHVQRISQRLGWTKQKEPLEIEQDLQKLFAQPDYAMLSHTLIFHGRRICIAQRPACGACGVHALCPSAGKAEKVGRKPPRVREAKVTGAKKPSEKGKAAEKPSAGKPDAKRAAAKKTSNEKTPGEKASTKAVGAKAVGAPPAVATAGGAKAAVATAVGAKKGVAGPAKTTRKPAPKA